jgi:hypothetical protein
MSWFGRTFGKKDGGSRMGNLLRAVAYRNTFGLLGDNMENASYGAILKNEVSYVHPSSGQHPDYY